MWMKKRGVKEPRAKGKVIAQCYRLNMQDEVKNVAMEAVSWRDLN